MPVVAVDGVELFFTERGSGSPILLVHGFGGNADVWGEAFDLLAQDHRVVAYDRRGFTRSAHAPVDEFQRHREDAAALLRELDAAPATVVGWSNGGLIALDLAVHAPELVAALVLQEAPLHRKRHPGLRQMRAVISAQLLSRVKDERAASEAFLRWALRYTSGGTGYDRLPDSLRQQMLGNGPANMADLAAGTGEHLTKEQIAGITCPVVCVTGELSDRAFARATDYIAGLVPSAEVKRIPGAGHGMHLERPADFAAAVRDAVPHS
jgi:pimeloyl-ACP methyl ester carboxylesterase